MKFFIFVALLFSLTESKSSAFECDLDKIMHSKPGKVLLDHFKAKIWASLKAPVHYTSQPRPGEHLYDEPATTRLTIHPEASYVYFRPSTDWFGNYHLKYYVDLMLDGGVRLKNRDRSVELTVTHFMQVDKQSYPYRTHHFCQVDLNFETVFDPDARNYVSDGFLVDVNTGDRTGFHFGNDDLNDSVAFSMSDDGEALGNSGKTFIP